MLNLGTHWDFREVFTYTTATQIRGLYDFAAIAEFKGDYARASYFSTRADALLNATLERLVHPELRSFVSHLNVANAEHFVDGSTIEMLKRDFVAPDDPIYIGTMNEYARLQTAFGGYRRLEEQLSLTGDAQVSEYDLSQWVLLDLRIGQAFRKMGAVERAETLLQYVTDSAVQNDHLVPELFNPVDGRFEGAIPMVGYGAGAWQVAQLENMDIHFQMRGLDGHIAARRQCRKKLSIWGLSSMPALTSPPMPVPQLIQWMRQTSNPTVRSPPPMPKLTRRKHQHPQDVHSRRHLILLVYYFSLGFGMHPTTKKNPGKACRETLISEQSLINRS